MKILPYYNYTSIFKDIISCKVTISSKIAAPQYHFPTEVWKSVILRLEV